MRSITIDGHNCYINNDSDFEEIIYQKCGKEASEWFRDYAKQFDNILEQRNDLFNTNLELLKTIDKEIKDIRKTIEQIYSIKEIVVTEFKRNDNLDKIESAIGAIECQADNFDRDECEVEKDFT